MSYRVEITGRAESDAEAIYHWIAQYSSEKSTLWYLTIQEAIESLADFPARCPTAPESHTFATEIRHLLVGNYRILFRIDDETVYVTHIRHSSRQTLTPETEDETDGDD